MPCADPWWRAPTSWSAWKGRTPDWKRGAAPQGGVRVPLAVVGVEGAVHSRRVGDVEGGGIPLLARSAQGPAGHRQRRLARATIPGFRAAAGLTTARAAPPPPSSGRIGVRRLTDATLRVAGGVAIGPVTATPRWPVPGVRSRPRWRRARGGAGSDRSQRWPEAWVPARRIPPGAGGSDGHVTVRVGGGRQAVQRGGRVRQAVVPVTLGAAGRSVVVRVPVVAGDSPPGPIRVGGGWVPEAAT